MRICGFAPMCTTRQFWSSLLVVAVVLNLALWSPLSSKLGLPVFLSTIDQKSTQIAKLASQRPLLILHWIEQPGFYLDASDVTLPGCWVSSCVSTSDRSLLSEADAVVINVLRMDISDLPERRLPHQRFVFVSRESPQYAGARNLKPLDGLVNLMVTYARDADVVAPYGLTLDGKQEGQVMPFNRSHGVRPVAWTVSHCQTPCKREQYVSQLRQHIPVDIYGKCGDLNCPGTARDCYQQLAKTHLFYLAFENSLCDDYITEKFWLALEAGMVPVVRGPSPEDYLRVAPPNSFIHVENFAGPKALASHLLALAQNQTAYERYHAWRNTHGLKTRRLTLMRDLCIRLHNTTQDRVVNVSKVWSVEANCHQPRDINTNS